MKKKEISAAEVKKVASVALTETQFIDFVAGRDCPTMMKSIAPESFDNSDCIPLEEGVVYDLMRKAYITLLIIKDNRRTFKRAMKMWKACHTVGMTTPAIVVDAKVVAGWGLPLADPVTHETVHLDDLDGKYCLMEGHGRLYGWFIEQMMANKDQNYEPFHFQFIYKHYDSPDEFGAAYTSCNSDMTRTTQKDRLGIAGVRCKNPLVQSYLSKIKDDHVVSKSSFYWTYGRELTKEEVTKITYEESDAPSFNGPLIKGLSMVYDAFKHKFSAEGAEKIYRGVPAAQWAADRLKDADDKVATANVIMDKLGCMSNDIYTGIITASSNSKKHLTRDQVIKSNLDKMMK